MSDKISYSKIDLGFPPWSLAFDPLNRGWLLVGGGGGQGQKENPNQLALLDCRSRYTIEKVAEISGLDDSPSSLDVLATRDGLIAFGGVNSPLGSTGGNKHLRSYKVDFPARDAQAEKKETAPGKIEEIGQTQMFSPSFSTARDSYQRLLRLSPLKARDRASKRIAAIASSLSPESEIVVYQSTSTNPSAGAGDVIQVIKPLGNAEANDIDIWEEEEGEFTVAYCTANEVYVTSISYDFGTKTVKAPLGEPVCAHAAPHPDASEKRGRAKYRNLRFISSDVILLLANIGDRSELQLIRLFPNGGNGELVLRRRLPRSMGLAVSMDVSLLDAEPITGARQVVIAVAAMKNDIHVLTYDYHGSSAGLRGTFQTFMELDKAHAAPMKQVVLSPFFSPSPPADTPEADHKPLNPQFLRLASISLANDLVIDTLPLFPATTKTRTSRFLLAKPARGGLWGSIGTPLLILGFVLGITLILFQSYMQAQSAGAKVQLMPEAWQNAWNAYRERAVEMSSPISRRVEKVTHTHAGKRVLDLLHAHREEPYHAEKKSIVLSHEEGDGGGLSHEVHEREQVPEDVKRWEDLTPAQQRWWREKLVKAGAWSADYGEGILKGVFFSELAGAVGRAAAEAIAG